MNMTVADNIFVMRQGLKKFIINRKQLRNQFYYLFQDIPNSLEPDKLISELTRLERCLVELFRAIVADGKLIIIQDISSYLNKSDLAKFYGYVQYYNKQGVAFLNIGNNHEELSQICDRMVLMKNARVIKIMDYNELQNIKPYSFSNDFREPEVSDNLKQGILTFLQVNTNVLKNVSFSVQKGECVVVLDNSNDVQNDFLELMHGKKEADSGKIYYNNKAYFRKHGLKAVENKILTIDKNPLKNMLFWDLKYLDNLDFLIDRKIGCSTIKSSLKKSIIDEYKEYVGDEIFEEDIKKLDLGSLYNLLYYRVHLFNPNILICIQPFTGADMYLRKHILNLLIMLKKKGITILIFSSNLTVCLSVGDRMLVFEDGQIVKSYEKNEFSHIID
jgi:ribose transport system ATP-binding protein